MVKYGKINIVGSIEKRRKVINFIVADDIKYFIDEVSDVINGIMMKNTFEYKIHTFDDYNLDFKKVIKNSMPNKIYILDIETKSASGLDMARMIRRDDVNSVIIFLTAHDELSSVVSKDQLMVLTFICKFDDFKNNVKSAISKSLKVIGKNTVIKFKDYSTVYTIDVDDILYVTRDSVDRKCAIKTKYTTYKVNKSLTEIKEMCSNKLIQTHRGCLVNQDRIVKIDKKKNEISLDNGEVITLVSINYMKELI